MVLIDILLFLFGGILIGALAVASFSTREWIMGLVLLALAIRIFYLATQLMSGLKL